MSIVKNKPNSNVSYKDKIVAHLLSPARERARVTRKGGGAFEENNPTQAVNHGPIFWILNQHKINKMYV